MKMSMTIAGILLGLSLPALPTNPAIRSIPIPGSRAFPESITSTSNGTLFIGRIGDGGIVRVKPRTGESSIFVQPGAYGSRSILGLFADEPSNTLWACSNNLSALGGVATGSDTRSALKAFDLTTGAGKLSVSLPGPQAFCNDIAMDAEGSLYLTDSANPTILKLFHDATTFEVFAQDPIFSAPEANKAGLDGIAFGSDGNLYVTTYAVGRLIRISVKGGKAGRITVLSGTRSLVLPDALRNLGNDTFLLVEESGTLDRLEIRGDTFALAPIHSGFATPTSVTQVGATAWVSEGNTLYFFDPSKRAQKPPLPFRIYAILLTKDDTK